MQPECYSRTRQSFYLLGKYQQIKGVLSDVLRWVPCICLLLLGLHPPYTQFKWWLFDGEHQEIRIHDSLQLFMGQKGSGDSWGRALQSSLFSSLYINPHFGLIFSHWRYPEMMAVYVFEILLRLLLCQFSFIVFSCRFTFQKYRHISGFSLNKPNWGLVVCTVCKWIWMILHF